MADNPNNNEENKGYLTEDDFLTADLDKANEKVKSIVEAEVKAAVAKALEEERAKTKQPTGGDDAPLTREQIDATDPAGLGQAIFADEDEDVRDTALTLLKSELSKLPEGATRKQVLETAAKVNDRISKLIGNKKPDDDFDPYKDGPLPTETSGASEAHIKDTAPKSREECEDRAMKIAASYAAKNNK